VIARGMKIALDHPLAGTAPSVASPMRFSATPLEFKAPPPTLGQHTDEILRRMLGMSVADIAQLRAEGIV
jgi:crotonobetainyl-CoA:carnitine CoA-transferase CaiB-like acyl-CoA transferase